VPINKPVDVFRQLTAHTPSQSDPGLSALDNWFLLAIIVILPVLGSISTRTKAAPDFHAAFIAAATSRCLKLHFPRDIPRQNMKIAVPVPTRAKYFFLEVKTISS
jgi:hypothetical protein